MANAYGFALSSNATLRVLVAQHLDPPELQADGSLFLHFTDYDNAWFNVDSTAGFEVQTSTDLLIWYTFPAALFIDGSRRIGFFDAADAPQRFYRVLSE